MDRGSGALRSIIIVLGSSWLGLILNILRVLVLPGKLGDSGLGMVTLAVSFTTFFGIFTSLGISTYMVRAVARDESLLSRYISNAFALRVLLGVIVLGVIIGLSHLLGYSPQTQQVILIVGISQFIFNISNVFESGLQAIGQMGWRAVATSTGQILATCVGVTLLLLGADAITYALSLVLGYTAELCVALAYFVWHRLLKIQFDVPIAKALLIGGMPLFLWGFLQTAYMQIDATLLSLFAGEHVVGWFGVASQIINVFVVVPGAITAVALPILCALHTDPAQAGPGFDSAANRTMLTTLLLMAPLGIGLAVSSGDLLRILPYPPVFANAAPVISLLGLALPITSVLMVMATLAVAIGQEKQWLKISVLAVCVFPPLYVVLISVFQTNTGNGAIGAALANVIGESLLLGWAFVVLPRRLRARALVQQGGQVVALTLAMGAIVLLLQMWHVSLFMYVPLAAAFYLGGAWLLHLVTPGDLQVVRSALRRRGRRNRETVPTPTV
jgi:O-antigen/teichoic acid export membrane protein